MKQRERFLTRKVSSRFLCPRPPLLLSAPNQNRHATQANQRLPVPGSLGGFPLWRNFYVRTRVYKIETIYGRSRVDVKVEPQWRGTMYLVIPFLTPGKPQRLLEELLIYFFKLYKDKGRREN